MNNIFDQHFQSWLDYLKVERGVSSNTLLSYTRDLKLFKNYLDKAGLGLQQATDEVITDFLFLQKEADKSVLSITRYIQSLRSFFKFLIQEDILSMDPTLAIGLPKKPERLPKVLNVNQVQQILTTGNTSLLGKSPTRKEELKRKERTLRYLAAFELMYATGMRVSELVNLQDHQLDLKAAYVRVFGKRGKERIVPLGRYAVHVLTKFLELRNTTLSHVMLGEGKDFVFTSSRGEKISQVTF
jgi:integrase/recombinase XerD